MNLTFRLFVLFFLIIFVSHKNISNTPISSGNIKVVGKGTITYVIPSFSPEVGNHIGYILKNPTWEIPPKEERFRTFLEPDSIIKNYLNQYVHIEGTQYKIPGKKINSYTFINPYDIIVVDKIYVIN